MPVRPSLRACLAALAVASGVLAPYAVAETALEATSPDLPAQVRTGLPDGVPPAALRPEPVRPAPSGWPFAEGFPRTSGTGRLVDGSLQWSDFLYDDHGAANLPVERPVAGLAPTYGSYTYPAGAARRNGADVFRTAVGLDQEASYWRVDWTTLADPAVPIAAFGLDVDGGSARTTWPAGAGVSSPGLDTTLLLSSRGAWLVDAAGTRRSVTAAGGTVSVDTSARSFVVRVPRALLPLSGTTTLRMVAGLANAAGDAFAQVPYERGARFGGTAVYNVGIRPHASEPFALSLWRESAQAQALSRNDVTPFSTTVDWAALEARRSTPEPLVRGASNRWYESSIEVGQGVVLDPNDDVQDLRPNFLGRIQPYTVHVPQDYEPGTPTPLTWLLHSLGVQHNQYASLNPKLLQQACEDRGAICVTTLGRGPDGWYHDEAEVDFWEVWNRTASAFTLDPERTVLAGYSMGGYGTYKLGLTYPDLFAKAVALAAPPTCGVRLVGSFQYPSGPGRCSTDGDTGRLVGNARSLPFVIAHGALDELVPVTSVKEQVDRFDAAGLRHRFELYPTEDHMAWAMKDAFSSPAGQMAGTRETDPGRISYTWAPGTGNAALGTGSDGAYWVRGLQARDARAGRTARVEAVSAARPEPSVVPVRTQEPIVTTDPAAGLATQLTWQRGAAPERRPSVALTLTNLSAASVDVVRAGLRPDATSTVTVTTDGPVDLTLRAVAPGSGVLRDGTRIATVDGTGTSLVGGVASGTVVTIVPPAPDLDESALVLDLPQQVRTTDALPVTARLTVAGEPAAERAVVLAAGAATLSAVTDADGRVAVDLPVDAAPGALEVTASYAGSARETPAAASAVVQVLPEVAVLTWTGDSRGRGETVRASAVLSEDDGPALAGRTVVFRVGERAVSATTDAAGVASAEVPAPDHGRSQQVTVDYAGDPRTTAARTTATVTWGAQQP